MSGVPEGLARALVFLTPGLPVAVALLWPFPRARGALEALTPWSALPALALGGLRFLDPSADLSVAWDGFAMGLRLAVDGPGGAFLLLTGVLWTAAGWYARTYHRTDPDRDHFFAFFCLTLAGNLGAVLAGDLLTFYLAFAVMTFAGYGLVVHHADAAALRAGRVYIVLALVGEACLLAAVLALGHAGDGAVTFGPELVRAWSELRPDSGPDLAPLEWRPFVAGLVVIGFGIKVGMAPLHVWLPLAHPVAPVAASALLSGVMIEVGVLGWMRVLSGAEGLGAVGAGLSVAGLLTAIYGAAVGTAQDDPKTVLAYSSVSQMGYLGLGTGLLLMAPELAPHAVLGITLFALHHGVTKACLFLSVGVVRATPSGTTRRRAVLAGTGLAALVLTGFPLTGGATAKEGLKATLGELGGAWYAVVDPIMSVAAVGTTVLMARCLVTVSRKEGDARRPGRGWAGLAAPWALLLVASATGPLWLTRVVPAPEGAAAPSALGHPVTSALPVMVGVALALGVAHAPRWADALRAFRVPPGDLLVPLQSALRGRRVPTLPGRGPAPAPWKLLRERTARGRRWIDALPRGDRGLARGISMAWLLVALALGLALGLG